MAAYGKRPCRTGRLGWVRCGFPSWVGFSRSAQEQGRIEVIIAGRPLPYLAFNDAQTTLNIMYKFQHRCAVIPNAIILPNTINTDSDIPAPAANANIVHIDHSFERNID